MRRLRLCLASTGSGGSGFPSGPTTGLCHCELAGRGQASGAKSPRVATSPEERTRVLRRRGGAPNRRCRVLLSPGDPGDKPRPVTIAPFGAPPPLTKGGKLKAHLARRRENAEAWLFEIRIRK